MYMILAYLVPFNGGVVHLVDEDDEFVDSRSFSQHGVFLRLTSSLKSRLKLAASVAMKK